MHSQANQARERFNTLLEEQPLILGAVGLAVGAMIGAAFPSTEQEDRLVGEIRDKTLNKGKELGAQAYQKGSELAKQNLERAVQTTSGEQPKPPTRKHDQGRCYHERLENRCDQTRDNAEGD